MIPNLSFVAPASSRHAFARCLGAGLGPNVGFPAPCPCGGRPSGRHGNEPGSSPASTNQSGPWRSRATLVPRIPPTGSGRAGTLPPATNHGSRPVDCPLWTVNFPVGVQR
jgi:hypothetical protein